MSSAVESFSPIGVICRSRTLNTVLRGVPSFSTEDFTPRNRLRSLECQGMLIWVVGLPFPRRAGPEHGARPSRELRGPRDACQSS